MKIQLIVLLLLVGCSPKVTKKDLQQLNGYWEIEKVSFANGSVKKFKASTTIDFIEINDMKGFRKKLQPKFNGTFETSDDAELFTIIKKENNFEFIYNENTGARAETIINISENNFSVASQDSLTYKYKRYQPMNLNQ